MKRYLPPLVAIRAFEAAARHRSFTLAAQELCVTQGAISLQVRKLEGFLEKPLFLRQTRKVALTDDGMLYYEVCRRLLEDLEKATERIVNQGRHEVLILSSIPTLSMLWLMPRLDAFTALHPTIEVRVVSDIRPVDIQAQGIDVALRVGAFPGRQYPPHAPAIDLVMLERWDDIQADLIFPDVMVPVASKAWVRQHGKVKSVAEFAHRELVHTASRPNAWRDWLAAYGIELDPAAPRAEFGHFYFALRAAHEQRGIALVPDVLLDGYPGRNELQVLLPDIEPVASAGAYYFLTSRASAQRPSMRLFREWILEQAALSPGISQANATAHNKSFVGTAAAS